MIQGTLYSNFTVLFLNEIFRNSQAKPRTVLMLSRNLKVAVKDLAVVLFINSTSGIGNTELNKGLFFLYQNPDTFILKRVFYGIRKEIIHDPDRFVKIGHYKVIVLQKEFCTDGDIFLLGKLFNIFHGRLYNFFRSTFFNGQPDISGFNLREIKQLSGDIQ